MSKDAPGHKSMMPAYIEIGVEIEGLLLLDARLSQAVLHETAVLQGTPCFVGVPLKLES